MRRWTKAKAQREVANAADLAELVQKRGRVDLFELETTPGLHWWRAMNVNERCAVIEMIGRRSEHYGVTVAGDIGNRLALTKAA